MVIKYNSNVILNTVGLHVHTSTIYIHGQWLPGTAELIGRLLTCNIAGTTGTEFDQMKM